MFCFSARSLALTAAVLISLPQFASADLTIGSKAPKLDVEHWVSNNNGKLPKVQSFQANKVYVVEFWATWCGPCVASMPHIAKLQKDYLEKGVQIISISDEDLETVEKFLDRPVPNGEKGADGKKQTFRELTAGYCLTTDPDQTVYKDYMEAAGEGGIPTAFIVGKDGVIEWIGHPMEMDGPLEQIVDGKWDRAKYIKQRKERQAIEEALPEVFAFMESKKYDKAFKKLDELIAMASDPELATGLGGLKIQMMIDAKPEEAAKMLKELVAKSNEVQALNALAWQVVESSAEKEKELPKELINAAVEAAEKAVKLAPKDGAVLDTLTHLVHLQGDLDKAIDLQKKAIALAPEMNELKSFLKQLQDEKAEATKK